MAKRRKKLVIKHRAVGMEKGRLKGRLKNTASNKGSWKTGRKR
jgi:hypothetical protein